ncbi:glycosyltransferase [Terriglobus saanensis]|uniref:Glycosyltransferase 28 domain protein n=1 Tax=Terriglobus saanensis (strain ATCC BAA-1853 / DSM 23119 / SP1PR4) TaxID=401053 RepID=E8V4E9_TERSS|nr:glycosyltransferase [Terriglobus saanensis]ADV84773.1 Glycosyltransferase 28 domain protein [Terriglobus saanensis SP1PR4]
MKILIAATGVPGYLNPLLAVAKLLMKHNHEVLVLTSPELKVAVLATGVSFRPEIPESKTYFLHARDTPKRPDTASSMEMFAFEMEHFFARSISAQAASLELALEKFPADLILADSFYFGTLPMLMGPRSERPLIAHLGMSVLNLGSGRNLPKMPGIFQELQEEERMRRERVLLRPTQLAIDRALIGLGCDTLPCAALESMASLPDLYLHPGIESFEYPYTSACLSQIRYIGPIPLPSTEAPLPAWWHDLDKKKRLVLVTQGTIANRDFGQLVGPTLEGLAKEEDVIVLVTTGGRPVDSIPCEIPSNARVAPYLSFAQLMPHIDLLITNGGYGTVNMALAHGVPIVAAGLTEDKEEVSAHVAWAGVGIDLRTNQADPVILRKAVREVLETPSYRSRAQELALEFASHDTEKELLSLLEGCVRAKFGSASLERELYAWAG